MDVIQTIGKVFGLSLAIALLLKYGISRLTIPSSSIFALLLVLLPTIGMSSWLLWRSQHSPTAPTAAITKPPATTEANHNQ